MTAVPRRTHRRVVTLIALAATLVAATIGAGTADADTRPPSASTPTTVSSDALPTAQINGIVWAQIIVGDIVYAGGSFTSARPAGAAAGSGTVSRGNVLAYRLSTGALISSFAPKVNGTVRSLAASSDGSTIYIGGSFSSVNGSTAAANLAAVTASSGSVVASFHPQPNATVTTIARNGTTLYVGGSFTRLGSTARSRAAALSTTGAIMSWAPAVADGRVMAIVVNGAAGRAVLGGSFSGLNGQTAQNRGSGMVDLATGRSNAAWSVGDQVKNWGPNSAIYSLTTDGTYVYGTGYVYKAGSQGVLEGTFSASWSSGAMHWVEDCHGDTYSSATSNGVVYIAGHPHFCGNIGGWKQTTPATTQRALAFSTAATGIVGVNTTGAYHNWAGDPAPSLLTWFPDFNTGTVSGSNQGPWSVAASGSYVVYGGEFTKVNGKAQQGLVRFAVPSIAPDKDGPRVASGDLVPTVSTVLTTRVITWRTVWDRDNTSLTYTLKRNGTTIATRTLSSTFWNRPSTTFTDTTPGSSPRYQVVVADPFGNTVSGPTTAG